MKIASVMNKELKITIIVCAIVFSAVGFLAFETIQDKPASKPLVERIIEKPTIQSTIVEKDATNSTLKIDDNIQVAETNVVLKIPANNTIPFGTIRGMVDYPAMGHPVIIQFFKSLNDPPVHIAQVDLKDDNTFEYKFRIFSIDDGITTHIFSGDYQIKIFTTVNILK